MGLTELGYGDVDWVELVQDDGCYELSCSITTGNPVISQVITSS